MARDRLIVIALGVVDYEYQYQLWTLALATWQWTFLGPESVSGMLLGRPVLDAVNDRLLLLNSFAGGPSLRVFTAPLTDPIALVESLPTGSAPSAQAHAHWADPTVGRTFLLPLGGPHTKLLYLQHDVADMAWGAIDLQDAGRPPSARIDGSLAWLPWSGQWLLVGGYTHRQDGNCGFNPVYIRQERPAMLADESASDWTPAAPAGSNLSANFGSRLTVDPERRRTLLFGGYQQSTSCNVGHTDTRNLYNASLFEYITEPSPRWQPIVTVGGGPDLGTGTYQLDIHQP